jgi:prepilin-type N-terminal cleavage/methylation domain-containing protein
MNDERQCAGLRSWVVGLRHRVLRRGLQTLRPKTKDPRPLSAAFTLVELLVVITIIGILIALLLLAVQAAREAARNLQCVSHLKQVALGCLLHEQVNGYLPTGGWGWGWSGDPDRGFTKLQPGGWQFCILPYLEQQALHDLGLNGSQTGRTQTAATPMECFNCPTRRRAMLLPRVNPYLYINIDNLTSIARSDYAANAGSGNPYDCVMGPGSLAAGDQLSDAQWLSSRANARASGVIFVRSMCKITDVQDGTSNTFLAGERNVNSDNYFTGQAGDDDQGWTTGFDYDVNRWTGDMSSDVATLAYAPLPDTPGYQVLVSFGSAHSLSFNMAMCDGSIHAISYTVDLAAYRRLGDRADGSAVDGKEF